MYTVYSDSPIIGGPSAGGAMTVATVAALLGMSIKEGVIMTGMINPDGTIGAVGGIKEKIDAAASINATIFLVPYGQIITQEYVTKEYKIGPFTYQETSIVNVNVSEYAKEKYNMSVFQVLTIYDAISYFLDINISKTNLNDYLKYLDTFVRIDSLKEEAYASIISAENSLNTTVSGLNSFIRFAYSEEINKAKQLIQEAKEAYTEGMYYSAISLIFQANTTLSFLNNLNSAGADLDNYIENMVRYLEQNITAMKALLNVSNITDGMIAAQMRILDAEESLKRAQTYYREGDLINTLKELSYAQERFKSAYFWLKYSGARFDVSTIKKEFSDEFSFATLLYLYISSMYGSQTSNEIYRYIQLAENAYSENLLGAAYMYAAQARAMAEAFLDTLGMSSEYLRDKVAYLKGIAITQISELNRKNITPILSTSYLEYSHYFLQKGDYPLAIGFIKLSHTWSETYLTFGRSLNMSINITIPSASPTSQNESYNNTTAPSEEEYAIDSRIILVTVLMFIVFVATFYYITRR
ncbi:MAG TPA: hypothetical protein ENI59_01535 [Euryarchaeota archaeon]|nr:hypothetical protein [Euryarchaeota archaeon]